MKISNLFKCICLATASLFMAQCTLDEEGSINSTSGRKIASITANGISFMKFTYDDAGRPTGLTVYEEGSVDARYTLSYDPMKIVMEEYEDNRAVSTTTYTNIVKNSSGFLVSMDAVDCTYSDNGNVYESFSENYYYNDEGQLIRISTTDEPNIDLTWNNGDLESYYDNEYFTINFKSLSTVNLRNQWNPLTLDNPLFMLGLLGNAPTHYIGSYKDNEGDASEYAYAFDQKGYIEKIKARIDGTIFVLNFNYQ